jgi:hypothetical protein
MESPDWHVAGSFPDRSTVPKVDQAIGWLTCVQ